MNFLQSGEVKVKVELTEDSVVRLVAGIVVAGFAILALWVVAKKM